MPVYVGDTILKFRAEAPDLPQVLGLPISVVLTGTTGGNISPTQNIYVIITALNQWGETLGTAESFLAPGTGNNAISVSAIAPPGATGGRAYLSPATGQESQWVPLTLSGSNLIGTIAGAGAGYTAATAGYPPTRNSAFMPDTDGDEISATLAFLWLNDALTELSRSAGGMFDTTGLNPVVGQQYYTVGGRWIRFVPPILYFGWPIDAARRSDIMYRYNVSGVVEIVTQEVRANQTVLAFNPQPGQAGNTTTLTAGMGTADSSLSCMNASAFRPNGRVQVDSEIMMFGQVNTAGTSISGLIRGVGGTTPATHANGATVTETAIGLSGFRYPNTYAPGQSSLLLDAMPAWEVPLHKFLMARYFAKVQLKGEADDAMKEFAQAAKLLEQENPGVIRARQMGAPNYWTTRGLRHGVIVD